MEENIKNKKGVPFKIKSAFLLEIREFKRKTDFV